MIRPLVFRVFFFPMKWPSPMCVPDAFGPIIRNFFAAVNSLSVDFRLTFRFTFPGRCGKMSAKAV